MGTGSRQQEAAVVGSMLINNGSQAHKAGLVVSTRRLVVDGRGAQQRAAAVKPTSGCMLLDTAEGH